MKQERHLPRLLVVDDLFGRTHGSGRNEERANLCAHFLLVDVTGDERATGAAQRIKAPIAEVVFFRGQSPRTSTVGDRVENDLQGTLDMIARGWDFVRSPDATWSMVLLDLCFYTGAVTSLSDQRTPGMPEGREGDDDPQEYFGLKILRAVHEMFPDLPVLILSSKPRESVNRAFSSHGALGFLDRGSIDSPELLRDYIWRYGIVPDYSGGIVGRSKPLLLALRRARQAAKDRRNVLIRGPRGTGKELVARFIHDQSDNARAPLAVVDSGTLNAQLYASELFGHKKGSFTGADRDRVGRIVEAHGGDLFLDEIGNMSADVQLGLLRAIEYRTVTPIGGKTADPVDVRFISATNEDIEGKAAVGAGFRLDLLDRLREAGTIVLPALCDRREDIPELITLFVRQAEASVPSALHREIDVAAFERCLAYDWPGNIRELRNCIISAVRRHPDIEYLVSSHLELPMPAERPDSLQHPSTPAGNLTPERNALADLQAMLGALSLFDFESLKRGQLEGLLPQLQRSMSRCISRYLKAVLSATTKPVEGRLQIHPAIKMATGDSTISASKAADIIKSLLKSSEADNDDILKEAYEIAIRLRPSQMKRSAPL